MELLLLIIIIPILLLVILNCVSYYNHLINTYKEKIYMYIFNHKDYKSTIKLENYVKNNKMTGIRFNEGISFPYIDNLFIEVFIDNKSVGIFDKTSGKCVLGVYWKDKSNSIYNLLLQKEIKNYFGNEDEYDKIIYI